MATPTEVQLETLIDQCTLAHVVDMLADICREKAAHILNAWQDSTTARTWDQDAAKLERIKLNN